MKARVVALLAVAGPGLLAGLSDDDPAGITTYSILGADYGYRLLWVLLLSTIALIVFHELGARLGVATGQGLIGLVRERYGVRVAGAGLVALVAANLGTTCAEFAGIAAGFELAGVSRYVSVPIAAVVVTVFVRTGSFRRVEHILLAVAAVFVAYILAGILAHPSWSATGRGFVVPTLPLTRDALLIVTATVGTTLAPWGLSFIQSYVADKRLTPNDMSYERVDVVVGSVLTGLIGTMVVVACAATLHQTGRSINSAKDAAVALEPLAGNLASTLFGVGLIGAALLAASILPLSTAYSVCEAVGVEATLDDRPRDAPIFYGVFMAVTVVAVTIVLAPGAALIPILYLTQVVNAILLLPLLVMIVGVARDRTLMGTLVIGSGTTALAIGCIGLVAVSCASLGVLAIV
jgi:NRAMP (natural resistance-associated macrophage protein)-like metal ion transporter